ncbi:MAG: hypothetical protein NTW19_02500 [Planctomycetota bacterium]|nr:hypothetical protein [Planctomycetota bacterium]
MPNNPNNLTGVTHNDLGQPVLRVRKDLLAVGTYRPPDRGWTLAVDRGRLQKLTRRFAEMKAAGVRVPVISVDARGAHNWKPENARGYLVELETQDDRLIGTLELIGEEAVRLPGRSEVSVGIHPDFRDGLGHDYGEVIDHVAICLNPVVPDQRSWRIAASRTGEAETRDDLALGAGPRGEGHEHDDESVTRRTLARPARDALVEALDARLERLVERGRITPAVRDRLREALTLDDALLLSRGEGGTSAPRSQAGLILDALADNQPMPTGEQTRGQAVALSRPVPGDTDASDANGLVASRLRAMNSGGR